MLLLISVLSQPTGVRTKVQRMGRTVQEMFWVLSDGADPRMRIGSILDQ